MEKSKSSKKNRKIRIKSKKRLIIIIIVCLLLVIGIVFGIFKWQDAKEKDNRAKAIEKLNKNMYTDMTSKEMYEETRQLTSSEKQGLVEMFIKKWKEDKKNNIDSVGDNETHARYLFCM